MAISRKNSRRIVVDDAAYRWSVSEDSGYSKLVIQHAAGRGQKLEITVRWTVGWTLTVDGHVSHSIGPASVTPAMVKSVIRFAGSLGWQAERPHPQPLTYRLQRDGSLAPLILE